MVEHQLPKLRAAGSIPVSRSISRSCEHSEQTRLMPSEALAKVGR